MSSAASVRSVGINTGATTELVTAIEGTLLTAAANSIIDTNTGDVNARLGSTTVSSSKTITVIGVNTAFIETSGGIFRLTKDNTPVTFTYDKDTTRWASLVESVPSIERALIAHTSTENLGTFGNSVAIAGSGDAAVLAVADLRDGGSGAVHVYTQLSEVWKLANTLRVQVITRNPVSFGYAMSFDATGDTLAVCAPQHVDPTTNVLGAVFIYRRQGVVWEQYGSLITGSDGGPLDEQGSAVELSADGKIVVFGARVSRRVYMFKRQNVQWVEVLRIDNTSVINFGDSVSFDAAVETIAVAPRGTFGVPLNVYIYKPANAGAWAESAVINYGAGANENYRAAVLLNNTGDCVVVSSEISPLFIFKLVQGVWVQQASFVATNAVIGNTLAWSQNEQVLVAGLTNSNTGWAGLNVYKRNNGVWAHNAFLAAPAGSTGSPTPGAIDASGTVVTLGTGDVQSKTNQATIWRERQNSLWVSDQSTLKPLDTILSSRFGETVRLSSGGQYAAIGAPLSSEVGSIRIMKRSGYKWSTVVFSIRPADTVDDNSGLIFTQPALYGGIMDMSEDGSVLATTSPNDNGVGAAWFYVRDSADQYNQVGIKRVEAVPTSGFGRSIAVDRYGDNIIIGGASRILHYKRGPTADWSLLETVSSSGLGKAVAFAYSTKYVLSSTNVSGVKIYAVDTITSLMTLVSTHPTAAEVTSLAVNYNATRAVFGMRNYGVSGRIEIVDLVAGAVTNSTSFDSPNLWAGASFGISVAMTMKGDTVAAGAHVSNNSGDVFVYSASAGVWSLLGPVKSAVSNGAVPNCEFGFSCAMDGAGSMMMVGAPSLNNEAGRVFFFS